MGLAGVAVGVGLAVGSGVVVGAGVRLGKLVKVGKACAVDVSAGRVHPTKKNIMAKANTDNAQ
jgi:UDP-3-O-[3-hydroxymyristoyl] glucosamine N-acyltransferase